MRLLGRRTLCLTGAKAAALFYDEQRFQRRGAAPEPLRATLFGEGGVQGLDGAAHRHRKSLFMSLTGPAAVAQLVQQVRLAWEAALPAWTAAGPLSLYRAVQPVLNRGVCAWAGVPLPEAQLAQRTAQLTALFDGAASGLVRHVQARLARRQAEHWLAGLIEGARGAGAPFAPGSPADVLSRHRDLGGALLPPRVAAVELLNLLRPTVAVSVYIAFVAHALQQQADWRERLGAPAHRAGALDFVQEVRRHYPFFPAVAAQVRDSFVWSGVAFPAGRRTLLDLYGTNHDRRLWAEPMSFRPERWQGRTPQPFGYVPQGGGEAAAQHRCPGEEVAVQLMLLALDLLLTRLRYGVDDASQQLLMNRLPALPRGGFVMTRVQLRA